VTTTRAVSLRVIICVPAGFRTFPIVVTSQSAEPALNVPHQST
jgi:hypothetical protein